MSNESFFHQVFIFNDMITIHKSLCIENGNRQRCMIIMSVSGPPKSDFMCIYIRSIFLKLAHVLGKTCLGQQTSGML